MQNQTETKTPLSADQAANNNTWLTKGLLVAHVGVSVLIFMISAAILTNSNREARLGIVADLQALTNLKWMALISCVLALVVIGVCGTLLISYLIGEPSRIKRTFNASFVAKVTRVYNFTTSGTVLYGSLLAATIAQAVLGLIMARAGTTIPAMRTLNGRNTYRTALKEGPVNVMVLGLVGSAATGFAMSYRSRLEVAYTAAYRSPVARAIGVVAAGARATTSGLGSIRSFFSPRGSEPIIDM